MEYLLKREGVEVVSEILVSDVTTMMSKVELSETVISKKYYEQCPNLIEEFTDVIFVVNSEGWLHCFNGYKQHCL